MKEYPFSNQLLQIRDSLFDFLDQKIYSKVSRSVSPRKSFIRWFALFFCCMSTIGGYYCQNATGPLQTPIMEIFGISTTKFNLLYTAYSVPNIIMPLLGGFIIDKSGVRIGLTLFALLIIVGQALITLGAKYLMFNVMLFGTAIMGVGLDALCAAKSTMVVKWFQAHEVAFAMGLTLTISRLGSSISSYLAPLIYTNTGSLAAPLAVGIGLGIFSLSMIGLLCFFDYYAEVRESEFKTGAVEAKEVFQISDMKNFKLIFYLIMLNCMLAYSVIQGFLFNASDLMNKRFGFNPTLSGKYLSIVFILATIFSPVFGKVADVIGKRVTLLLGSFFLMGLANLQVVLMTDTEPGNPNTSIVFSLIGTGMAYSAYAAIIWPCVSMVVEDKANGTAYGFALAMQNLMLSIVPLVIGYIHDGTMDVSHGYYWTEVFLVILAIIGTVTTVWIKSEDGKNGSVLEAAPVRENNENYKQMSNENSVELSVVDRGV